MSRARIAGFFVAAPAPAPASARGPAAAMVVGPAARVGVLGEARGVRALGATAALGEAGGGSGIAVLACWRAAGRGPSLPGTPRARRLAASLAARGVVARAGGRLVICELDEDEQAAVQAYRRIDVAAGATPLVVALGGPRGEPWDGVLVGCDRVAVHSADGEVAALAAARLAEQGAPRVDCVERPAPLASAFAGRGLALPGLRRTAPAVVREEHGQATVLLVGALLAILLGAFALGALARALGAHGREQRAADLGALAGARAMRDSYPRLFEPLSLDGTPNPRHLSRAAYLDAGRARAAAVARANGASAVAVTFPDADPIAPVRVRVGVGETVALRAGGAATSVDVRASADAQLTPDVLAAGGTPTGDEYPGPFASRQGQRMRPDVAQAFDRMNAAATAAGHPLLVVSAFRSNAEQARLFAAHPDPKWVAPPGRSLHRLATELDLGPDDAWPWLVANAPRFRFVKRYAWEPWHFGLAINPSSSPAMAGRLAADRGLDGHSAIPSFVPAGYAAPISRAAQRWNVSATLLAAQLYQESRFNPFARSDAGAQGIAQFMPATAAGYGLADPFDAEQSIDAQAHLMRDLLRQFGAVPLALAAYNAGPAPVARCGCVPPIPETTAYVAAILGLMGGATGGVGVDGLTVRLVR